MVVLTCFRTRRRIGAYLDGALEGVAAQSTARHLSECRTCQGEAEALRRVRALLQRTAELRPGEPDWSGFWPGIVRGVEDARRRQPPPVAIPRRWWRPRWALGGAVAAVGLLSLTLWQTMPGLTNTAGNLALHVAGNLQHYVGTELGNTAYKRDRNLEFSPARPTQKIHAARSWFTRPTTGT